jgi:hypothetical protein
MEQPLQKDDDEFPDDLIVTRSQHAVPAAPPISYVLCKKGLSGKKLRKELRIGRVFGKSL